MGDRMFDQPVLVINGQFIQELGCLEDAFDFLHDWPRERRGPIFETAFRACQRAYDGQVSLSVARDAVAGFARSVKILQEPLAPLPWMGGMNSGRGGIAA
ncbi:MULTISPECIES: DUF982 domain-containing protein [Mesorhizobium]|uniref:DUF982 domain-containing protein n=1 Tax=Mesorhizobium opportunistum (strain LMG 24607 / HAMBI 3007 / WSM2075) TaxID=536019 RepID=F7Y3K2_MESOW|nr:MULTISPECIES: DUF982 domain-containing protein [Mesorhizobium]AEH88395.1 protein of unknown function DUF982 [Mesorhizobium opportunistum WSM2075]MCA0034087.1 DUF982 domain-containing protein [Mesorhizobium sp. B263B2A]TPN48212.1 DUF982 domain-containing protein [Mesorhizobium sp. B1-1-7]TPN52615.1 DUF982 domain-containing protein [Mesorhizobium sp. B1-1-9]